MVTGDDPTGSDSKDITPDRFDHLWPWVTDACIRLRRVIQEGDVSVKIEVCCRRVNSSRDEPARYSPVIKDKAPLILLTVEGPEEEPKVPVWIEVQCNPTDLTEKDVVFVQDEHTLATWPEVLPAA